MDNKKTMQQKRQRSQSTIRSQQLSTTPQYQDLNKFNRQELLKFSKRLGIQNPHKKYIKKDQLIGSIINNFKQQIKRGKSKSKLYEIKQKKFTSYIKYINERKTVSGMIIKTYYPTIFHKRSEVTFEQLNKFFTQISYLKQSSRQLINVHLRHEDGTYEQIDLDALIKRENRYVDTTSILDYDILKIEQKTLPLKGGCDSVEHTWSTNYYAPNGEKYQLTFKSTRTKRSNCLINIFAKKAGKKQLNADYLRKQLGIPLNVCIEPEKAELLSKYFQVSYKIFAYIDETVKIIAESQIQYDKNVEIFLNSELNHYLILVKRPDDLTYFRPQHIIQDTKQKINIPADKVIVIENKKQQEEEEIAEYTHDINYAEVLNDPDIDTIKDRVYNTPYHIFINGQGGVGKTWTINQLKQGITKTATTGIASTHINGNTIHHYMQKKLKDCEDIIVIDEISFMGTSLFQKLYQMIKESKRQFRLIICGDILQLPPVLDGFFFQCYEFVKFAKKCIRINLTQIKRQNNVDQQVFLNDFRVGKIDKQYLKKLYKNKVVNPQVIICGTNPLVDYYNNYQLQQLQTEKIIFEPKFQYINQKNQKIYKKASKEYQKTILCVGSKVMLLNNIDVQNRLVNGAIGIIKNIDQQKKQVLVQFDHQLTWIPYVQEIFEDQIQVNYMPLKLCYAITVHKAQGCTFDSAQVEKDLFENGQMYVAISRVKDLNNLQLIGDDNTLVKIKSFEPNMFAYNFCFKNVMMTQSEIMLIEHSEKQLKGIKTKQYKKTKDLWNHIYLDFETYLVPENDMQVQKPYFNKILHHKNGTTLFEKTLFDQLWEGGQRCDVAGYTWQYIKQTMIQHGDNLQNLKQQGDQDSIKIYKSEKKKIPTIVAYNGSGFDFQFILKRFLNDKTCSRRFEINNIFKGSRLIFLLVRDKYSGEIVLKTHDMSEILCCPLQKALTDFCNIDKQIVEKIEFKEEILYIMNNYHKNPNILKQGVISTITKRLFTSNGIVEKQTQKQISLHDEVIKYAENDVNVLPILYESMDELCKTNLQTNITSFITAGSLAWYGFLQNLPNECLETSKYDKNRNKSTYINSKLFRLEKKELKFIQGSIKGGRVCPRIHSITNDQEKHVYLDISGMYAAIMKNEKLPFGKSKFLEQIEIDELNKTIKQLYNQNIRKWKTIYDKLTEKFGLFIAKCDFEENPMNLEPIIQYKKDNKTYYTLERRIDKITSLDISLILASGGQIHGITRVLQWQNNAPIMSKWIQKTLDIKNEGQRTNNSGLRNFGKLGSNSAFGQTLKGDKNEVIRFINCYEDADEFVNNNQLTKFFDMDDYDVYIGKKQIDNETFKTSRCQHIGAFILAYTRAMIYDICETAMPNRYNEKGIYEQPIYGDTDSLIFREWQAHLLIKAGWIKFENGKLTDELGEKSHWFCPKRLEHIMQNKNSLELQQEQIWKESTEDEKRDPNNFKFHYVTEGIFVAPKSYACKYDDNDHDKKIKHIQEEQGTQLSHLFNINGLKHLDLPITSQLMWEISDSQQKSDPSNYCIEKEKMKFKGIPTTALINQDTLDYKLINQAYTNKHEHYIAVLQSKPQVIKNFSKRETKKAFLDIVDSNLRRSKFVQRQLFKTQWQGRYHIDQNTTVPYGYNKQNNILQ